MNLQRDLERELDVPGVYVYTAPIYLAHPDDDGNVLLKVGRGKQCLSRFRQQETHCVAAQRQVLQRIYRAADYVRAEKNMHRSLELARYRRSDGGREWFVTNLAFLDSQAINFGMEMVFPMQPVKLVADDASRKYVSDVKSLMGRGRSLRESIRHILERNPNDVVAIQRAYEYFADQKELEVV